MDTMFQFEMIKKIIQSQAGDNDCNMNVFTATKVYTYK